MKIEEIEKLRYDIDGGLPWPSAYKVEKLCAEVVKLLAVAKAAKELFGDNAGKDLGLDWSCHQKICDALEDLERE